MGKLQELLLWIEFDFKRAHPMKILDNEIRDIMKYLEAGKSLE